MKIVELEEIINNAFEDLQNISEKSDANIINAIKETIELTDKGEVRVAIKENGKWSVNQWIKNNEPWAAKFSDSDFINYKTEKLAIFLKEINEKRRT